jgi:hypothetical protein
MDTSPDLEKAQAELPWWKRGQQWPRKKLYLWLAGGFFSLVLLGVAIGLAVHFSHPSAPAKPLPQIGAQSSQPTNIRGAGFQGNFADPSYITENNVHYAFATNRFKVNRPGQIHIQMAVSNDFGNWTLTDYDALPNPGPWTTRAFVWAPDVVKLVSLM